MTPVGLTEDAEADAQEASAFYAGRWIVVLVVGHHSRRPGYWQDRL